MVLTQRQQRTIQFAVIGAITVLFVLVIVMVALIASRHAAESRAYNLERQLTQMEQRIVELERDINFAENDPRFVEEYILFEIGFGPPGTNIVFGQ